MKLSKEFWKKDWFLASAVVVVFCILWRAGAFDFLENKFYDVSMGSISRTPSDNIAVIAIDDISITNIGRWPWSRTVHGEMLDKMTQAKAKVVAPIIFFSEPQQDPGLKFIELIKTSLGSGEKGASQATGQVADSSRSQLLDIVGQAESQLNSDRNLAQAVAKANTVVLPVLLGDDPNRKPEQLPPYLEKSSFDTKNITPSEAYQTSLKANFVTAPIVPGIAEKALAIGQLNAQVDTADGVRRVFPMVVSYSNDAFIPSFSLAVVGAYMGVQPKDMHLTLGGAVQAGSWKADVDEFNRAHPLFYRKGFQADSFYDVLNGRISLDKYKDKIVLIGPTAAGVGNFFPTPVNKNAPAVEVAAHEISSLLQGDIVTHPFWAAFVSFFAVILVTIYLIVMFPRLKANVSALWTVGGLVLFMAIEFFAMTQKLIWIPMVAPLVFLVLGHVLLTAKRYMTTERGKAESDAVSAESNRRLGLAYQGQGQLDMAWDMFVKVPMNDTLMDNLYSLALDFERKRQFNKAQAIFQHMQAYKSDYKDLTSRIERTKRISETVVLGGASSMTDAMATVAFKQDGTVEKPVLGRYVIEKELGKGAMGVVYLGRDPKINRVVAIKTMPLSQGFDEDEVKAVKERFFREAETAGRLNHPNIVTIYDAGEEHDLCYIAMELLQGHDMANYVKEQNLLPVPQVVKIVATVADALAYAHGQGVVHRDVKPGNIMYQSEKDLIKVTDFGIARIVDTSRTKTGTVLGTPSFMSPEQLAGQRIDGQSDLFSLGVTLYQLLSAKLPFHGESLTHLMYQIANEKPDDIRKYNEKLPDDLLSVIERALAKDKSQRYASGSDMARDLRQCLSSIAPTV